MNSRFCGSSEFHENVEMTSVAMNGSCVITIMKISAGSSGARRDQPVLGSAGAALTAPAGVGAVCTAVMPLLPLVLLAHLGGHALTLAQRRVDRRLAGDRRAPELRDVGAEL